MHPLLTFGDHQESHFHVHHPSYHRDMDRDIQMDIQDAGANTKAEMRKSNKPIMEKRRRARINNCLTDLKGILLEAMRKDPARHSKLEKADILELTVRHLQNVQRNQLAVAMATDPTVVHRFKNGFSECATEVNRYIGKLDGIDTGIRHRLSNHLGSCVNGLQQVGPFGGSNRYSLGNGPFAQPLPNLNPSIKSPVPSEKSLPVISAPAVQIPCIAQHPPNNVPISFPHSLEDVNNNNPFPIQANELTPNTETGPTSLEISHRPIQFQGVSTSAFSTVARLPLPSEEAPLLSPQSSANTSNVSISLVSSGSDTSSCAGTTPNISLGLSPIDFSLKIKDKQRAVRVLKVEPMMAFDDSTSLSKGSMWRPW